MPLGNICTHRMDGIAKLFTGDTVVFDVVEPSCDPPTCRRKWHCIIESVLGTDTSPVLVADKSGWDMPIVATSGPGEEYDINMSRATGVLDISCNIDTIHFDTWNAEYTTRTATIHPAPPDCGLVAPEPPAVKARADVCKGRNTKQVRTESGLCWGAAFCWLGS